MIAPMNIGLHADRAECIESPLARYSPRSARSFFARLLLPTRKRQTVERWYKIYQIALSC
jgi:hypothetical protein